MPVPANPTLSQVCAEFLVAGTTPLSSFRRGAGIVPDTPTNAGVPTTLPIHLSQLTGASRVLPTLSINVTPDSSTVFDDRGNVISQPFTANISGGVGPFSFSWFFAAGGVNITLINSSSQVCTASSTTSPGPVDVHRTGTLQCTVTDHGAGGVQGQDQSPIDWFWEGVDVGGP